MSLDAASRMGLISVTFTTEATWPGPTVTLSELGRTDSHTESSEMGSHRGPQLSSLLLQEDDASSCSGWGQAGEQSSCWGGAEGMAQTLPGAH